MKKSLRSYSVLAILSVLTILLTAYSSNPPEDYSGAPPLNRTCASCHGGGNNFDGEISISGLPEIIEPESNHTITVTVNNPNGMAVRAGFQLVALDENNENIGTFGVTTGGAATQNVNNRTYVEHRGPQSFDANNNATWTVEWTSPDQSSSADSIKFYAAGNIANGGGTSGDRIVSTSNSYPLGTPSPALSGNIQINQHATCNGSNDGSATVTIETGTAPYTYSWSDNAGSSATINTLSAGDYTVTITDATMQSVVLSATITEPSLIAINIQEKGDIDCNNDFGFIRVLASAGVGNYQYDWSNGTSGNVVNQLALGIYTVTVTDENNCQNSLAIEIQDLSVHPNVEAGNSYTLDCNNPTNTLSAAGSSVGNNISYFWEASSGGNIVSGENTMSPLIDQAGFYILTVTNNGNGCIASDNVEVFGNFNPPTAAINSPDVIACNSTITLDGTASSGNGNLAYEWTTSNGGNIISDPNSATITANSAGNYHLKVINLGNGCSDETSVFIQSPTPPTAMATVSNTIDCNNITATIAATGSTSGSNITYQWTTNDGNFIGSTDIFSTPVDASGTYILTVTDNENNCSASTSIVVQQNTTLPNVDAGAAALIPCNSDRVRLDARNSDQGDDFTYEWTTENGGNIIGGATNLRPTVNAAGTYILNITNINTGCTAMDRVVVSNATPPTANAGQDMNLGCNGTSLTLNGMASSQGENLIYSWTTNDGNIVSGETTLSPTIDQSGTYTISVFNTISGCAAADEVQVNFAEGFNLTITDQTDILCHNAATGSATVSPNGGIAPFNYLWSNGNMSATVGNLTAGSYTVTVTDGNNCSTNLTIELTQPDSIELEISANPETQAGANNGRAQVIPSGGLPPYTYNWSNGGTTAFINNLQPGSYQVTVTDANNCMVTASTTVNAANCSLQIINAESVNVSCNNGADGTASIVVNGGLTPYQYAWSNGATTSNITNLIAGNYAVTVTDAGNCNIETSITISEPPALVLTESSVFNVNCNGEANGSAIVHATGGMGDYQFQWSSGSLTNVQQNLSAGTYSVTVFDDNGCFDAINVTINEPTALTIDVQGTNESAVGANDGTANVNSTGGTPPYSYQWSNNSTASTISNLTPGSYQVTVTDANNCMITASTTVNAANCSLQIINAESVNVSCNNGADGTASIVVNGGLTPYQYAWSNGATTSNITNLTVGNYSVTVTDAGNCNIETSITISEPPALVLTESSVFNVNCNGEANGSAIVQATGGMGDYQFQWSSGSTNNVQQNLSAGTYSVTVFDNNGCFDAIDITITEPPALVLTESSIFNVNCNGEADGSAIVQATGGMGDYQFQWSSGSTTNVQQNLSAGTYSVTVFDDNGCLDAIDITITEPTVLTIDVQSTNETTAGANDGTANAISSGGTPPYNYQWSNGEETEDIENLTSGEYSVTVTDDNGCAITSDFVIQAIDCSTFDIELFGTDVNCFQNSDGTVSALPMGGVSPYVIQWNVEDTTMVNSSFHTVTVTDALGCQVTDSIFIAQPSALHLTVGDIQAAINGEANGSATVMPTGGTPTYSIEWQNSNGDIVSTENNPSDLLPDTYQVILTDANGCTFTLTDIIIENITNTKNLAELNYLQLYPNPTNDVLLVDFQLNKTAETQWILHDFMGKKLKQSTVQLVKNQQFKLDLSNYPSGVYWLKLQIEDQWIIRKVLKK